ncbi:hypothetical protein [Candidatus Endoriftia persephone]|jgi:hypothetical protein|uniref:Uncharacterized protein n=3 Tax=Gammaproteobacteria TaxID=1236 RepID=G2DE59_9GAMM|nr:hypothetical protein [Candidatus Endoriftia persephone]EGV51069.1 hypothetical protein Rifp1Sym_bw00040 [endosymbiont of Riftia pachyptila (vent Ph05)]KRT56391.1 hypothetical protein Ga0074115_14318 [endosymbiont of Ridgeia piscesae]KRT59407.1 hypothetical protein Ga0076813_154110 [endosymbiont of Ridgeia piscesae]USF88127.1 hypothetical protein L0Y14_02470 [Candidatus Endoriftia persephone]
MMHKRELFRWFLCVALLPASGFARVEKTVDPTTQLSSWKLSQAGLELKLVQRLPDQTRGFFQARGFSKTIADQIATHCVLQTIARNRASDAAAGAISIDLNEWRIRQGDKVRGLKLKESWDAEWGDDQVSAASRIAFRWATFPTRQTFEPAGDYNWGMTSFGPLPGSRFDLKVVWREGDEQKIVWIEALECAEDR